MSKYTGKCDFYDTVYMIHGVEDILKTADIYYGDVKVEVKDEQFEIRTHKRLIDISNPRKETIDAIKNLDLPSGVDIEVKL